MIKLIFILFFFTGLVTCNPYRNGEFERIVTDSNKIYYGGLRIDYSYNETYTGPSSSVPGCPKSIDGSPWVYHGTPENPKCYLAGEMGPCGSEQVIFIEDGNQFGFCNCKCFEGVKREGDKQMFCKGKFSPFESVFIPEKKKCFELYEKGPCKENEWLVKAEGSAASGALAKCERRNCPIGLYPVKYGTSNLPPPPPYLGPDPSSSGGAPIAPPYYGPPIQTGGSPRIRIPVVEMSPQYEEAPTYVVVEEESPQYEDAPTYLVEEESYSRKKRSSTINCGPRPTTNAPNFITKRDCEAKNMKYSEKLSKCFEDNKLKFVF